MNANQRIKKAMSDTEKKVLREIREANEHGFLGSCRFGFKATERLEKRGEITFLEPRWNMRGGYVITGWSKAIDRAYSSSWSEPFNCKPYRASKPIWWNPKTKKRTKRAPAGIKKIEE